MFILIHVDHSIISWRVSLNKLSEIYVNMLTSNVITNHKTWQWHKCSTLKEKLGIFMERYFFDHTIEKEVIGKMGKYTRN